MISGKSEEEIIGEHFEKLRDNLISLNSFFGMNVDFKNLSHTQLLDAYKEMYEYYRNISQPINPEELKEATINAKTSNIIFENNIVPAEASIISQQIFGLRLKKTLDQQKKCWENIDEHYMMHSEMKVEDTHIIK